MLKALVRQSAVAAAVVFIGAAGTWAVVEGEQAQSGEQAKQDKPCSAQTSAATERCAVAGENCPDAAVSKLVLPEPDASPFLAEEDFVMNWRVLGPFKFGADEFGGGDQQAAADKEFMPNEGALCGNEQAPQGTKWETKLFTGNLQPGQVDLEGHYGDIDHAVVYGVACLDSPQDVENVTVWTGADDYITVWINGDQVLKYNEKRRGSDWDQDVAEGVKLKKGCNRVVVKVTDVVGGYDFYFRLTDKDGNPIVVQPVVKNAAQECPMQDKQTPAAAAVEPTDQKEPEGSPEE